LPLTALIVDDDPLVSAALANMLQSIGCKIGQVIGAKADALAALLGGGEIADVAFVDVHLDVRGGGVEVANAAAARGLRVIVVTGADTLPDGMAGDGLLLKPFSIERLEAVLRESCARR